MCVCVSVSVESLESPRLSVCEIVRARCNEFMANANAVEMQTRPAPAITKSIRFPARCPNHTNMSILMDS